MVSPTKSRRYIASPEQAYDNGDHTPASRSPKSMATKWVPATPRRPSLAILVSQTANDAERPAVRTWSTKVFKKCEVFNPGD
jgi:hypothetical protein